MGVDSTGLFVASRIQFVGHAERGVTPGVMLEEAMMTGQTKVLEPHCIERDEFIQLEQISEGPKGYT